MNIKIHNMTWTVVMVEADSMKMNPGDGFYNFGLVEPHILKISIRKGLPEPLTRMTVIHELAHAFICTYGYKLPDEEAVCDFIGAHAEEIVRLSDQIIKGVIMSADHSRD